MLHLNILDSHVQFMCGDQLAGRYNHRDARKPYFDPLKTPRGHSLTLAAPNDHKHHKGLMFALRTAGTNFWEETATRPEEAVGRQEHVAFEDVVASGESVGFTQTLRWRDLSIDEVVFNESRDIRLRLAENAFQWTWRSQLTPSRDVVLIQSQWSHKHADDRRTNYHGLGVRLRREFGGPTGRNQIAVDGHVQDAGDFATHMGRTPERVTFTGTLDGTWPQQRASITMVQQPAQKHGLYVMNQAFAFMSLGPSNITEMPLQAGEPLVCAYDVVLTDD